jgi:hypothetical protein
VSRLGPCGVWLALSTEDLILFEQETSRLHQQHIILHEVGHLLCEHQGELLSAAEELQLLLPSLDPGMVRHVLHRNVYSTEEEREAELLAAMIVERAGQSSLAFPQAVTRRPDTDLTAASLRRLEAALDGGLSAVADLANR